MVEPGTTGLPVPGTSVFFTVKLGTGFVTVDVQLVGGDARACGDGGRVLTLVVSVADTLAVKVTFTEWPAARVTWMARVLGVCLSTVTEQASVAATVLHLAVVDSGSGWRRVGQ